MCVVIQFWTQYLITILQLSPYEFQLVKGKSLFPSDSTTNTDSSTLTNFNFLSHFSMASDNPTSTPHPQTLPNLKLHEHEQQLKLLSQNSLLTKNELMHLVKKLGSLKDLLSNLNWILQIDFIVNNAKAILSLLRQQKMQLRAD